VTHRTAQRSAAWVADICGPPRLGCTMVIGAELKTFFTLMRIVYRRALDAVVGTELRLGHCGGVVIMQR